MKTEFLDNQILYNRLFLQAVNDKFYRCREISDLLKDTDYLISVILDCLQQPGMAVPGFDGETAEMWYRYSELAAVFLEKAHAEIYQASPVRRIHIPKSSGKIRYIGIPNLSDRILQKAIARALEPVVEADFLPSNFGYRPGLGSHQAVSSLTAAIEQQGFLYILKSDIASFFDTVNHDILFEILNRRIDDPRLIRTISALIKAETYFNEKLHANEIGLCQGSCLSPLMSNIYLHLLDVEVSKILMNIPGHYARYCDDFIVLTHSANEAAAIRNEIEVFLGKRLKLALSTEPHKSFITHINQGVTFLGCTIIRERDRTGNFAVKRRIPKSRQRIWRQRIDDLLTGGLTQAECTETIQPMLMGIQAQYQLSKTDTTMRKLTERVIYPQRKQR